MATVVFKSASQRYTLGVVYEPDIEDTHDEYAKAEDIEKAAWDFMARQQAHAAIGRELLKEDGKFELEIPEELLEKGAGLDVDHLQLSEELGVIVESYIAPCDFMIGEEPVQKGSWLLGVVWTPEVFDRIQAGELNGLSMYGLAKRVE